MKSLFAAVFVLVSACGVVEQPGAENQSVGVSQDALLDDNGMSANGFSANGMSANGFSANGMSANGFSANGLVTILLSGATLAASGTPDARFAAWFDSTPTANEFMTYFVKCALPAGERVTFRSYSWAGVIGVAPNWKYGSPTTADQERVTACLMAHVNADGMHVSISVRSNVTSYTQTEATAYGIKEGMFFGNIFAPTRTAYSCSYNYTYQVTCSGRKYTYTQATLASFGLPGASGRTCATNSGCGFVNVGNCFQTCPQYWSGTCTVNGVGYTNAVETDLQTPAAGSLCGSFM